MSYIDTILKGLRKPPMVERVKLFHQFSLQDRVSTYGKKALTFLATDSEALKTMKVASRFEILDKGCLMHVVGEKHPIRANTPYDKVSDIAKFKKIVPLFIRFLRGKNSSDTTFTKKNIFTQFLILLSFFQYKELFLNFVYLGLRDVYGDVNTYSQPVREVYRLIKHEQLREVFCAVLEFDTAYRYRFQDIFPLVDKKYFDKHPVKEMNRLGKTLFSRENPDCENGLGKLKPVFPLLLIYLFLNKGLLKEIKNFVREADLNEIKLSVEDIYWTNIQPDYQYRGVPYKKRLEEYEKEKEEFLTNAKLSK